MSQLCEIRCLEDLRTASSETKSLRKLGGSYGTQNRIRHFLQRPLRTTAVPRSRGLETILCERGRVTHQAGVQHVAARVVTLGNSWLIGLRWTGTCLSLRLADRVETLCGKGVRW